MKVKTKTDEFIAEFALGCMDAQVDKIAYGAKAFCSDQYVTTNLLKTHFTVSCKKCEKELYMARGGVWQGIAGVPVTREMKCICPCGEENIFTDEMYEKLTGDWCDKFSATDPYSDKNIGSVKSKTLRRRLFELYILAYNLELEYLESLEQDAQEV